MMISCAKAENEIQLSNNHIVILVYNALILNPKLGLKLTK